MAINVNVQYNVGFSPTLYCCPNVICIGEEVLYLQPLVPPKRFDIFSPITGECSEGLGVL